MASAALFSARSAPLRHSHVSDAASASVTAPCAAYATATLPPHIRVQENTL
jgi:hypothetical protein